MSVALGDYVLATKYHDGDPGDDFCVGRLQRIEETPTGPRYYVVDNGGSQFRGNGFRRVKKISHDRGVWLVNHFPEIEYSGRSLWGWVRWPMNDTPTQPLK